MSDCCDRQEPCTEICARTWENAYYSAMKDKDKAIREARDAAFEEAAKIAEDLLGRWATRTPGFIATEDIIKALRSRRGSSK